MSKERVLIVDFLNLFLRNWIADPSIDARGNHCGGCKGTLKSLQKLLRETNATQIIFVYDGTGGSKRKKKLFEGYKDGRKPVHLNRNINNLSFDEEQNNRNMQLLKLSEYLNLMPVAQICLSDIEADDIIARVCNLRCLQDKIKIIVSSDKDFFQLCRDDVLVLRPVQNEIMNTKRIINKFGIHPNNFALARAIAGDKSDNLDGVGGVQLPTIAKKLSFLKEEKVYSINDVLDYCEKEEHNQTLRVFRNILDNKEKIELNYKIMQLYIPNISPQAAKQIKDTVENFEPSFNQTEVVKGFMRDGYSDYSWDLLFNTFKNISSKNKQFKKIIGISS